MGIGKKLSKALAGDLVYSIAGLVCMNGVIQLFMYPYLEKLQGSAAFGDVLTLLAVVSILATTFGLRRQLLTYGLKDERSRLQRRL